ncbi:MAG: hypothetical protein H6714_07785 [Myxococcales bacterium]|nr:hypothetical protein [Myxococcales bacterium]
MAEPSYFINLKLFVAGDGLIPQDRFIPLFHQWIKEAALDDVLIDVADYRHVHHGPGVILVGHSANFSLDEADGRTGLLYSAKRSVTGQLQDQLKVAFRRVLDAALLIEQATADEGPLRFAVDSVLLRVHNRLATRRDADESSSLEHDIATALRSIFPALNFQSERAGREREPWSVLLRLDPRPKDVQSFAGKAVC